MIQQRVKSLQSSVDKLEILNKKLLSDLKKNEDLKHDNTSQLIGKFSLRNDSVEVFNPSLF